MSTRIDIEIPDGIVRKRLEDFLFDRFPNLSRMYLRDVIKGEQCEVNGRIENKGKRVSTGDFIEIEIDGDRETAMMPQEMRLDIVYEDVDLILINKPSGILVHPTHRDKSGTLLNGLAFYLNKNSNGANSRPGLVHRLDKETSGLMVIAKNVRCHRILAKQFRLKTVKKLYVALVDGTVKASTGTIESKIGRFADEKRWGTKSDGKHAVTRFRVRQRNTDSTFLELEPITGRTNQLRIHCASIGHPIVGDIARGGREYERLCLHAWKISFRHPSTHEQIELTCEPDESFRGGASRRVAERVELVDAQLECDGDGD